MKNCMKPVEFNWPIAPGTTARPLWTGTVFQVGERTESILAWDVGEHGWNDDLTQLHETATDGSHPIDVASRKHAVDHLGRYGKKDGVILEVGCSSGFLLKDMQRAFPDAAIIGSDFVYQPLERLAKTDLGIPLMQMDLTRSQLDDATVDSVVMLNVLEHIEDHEAAIRHTYRILKPGGIAVIEVPAGPELFDDYDRTLHHFRRYAMSDLVRLVRRPGFEVLNRSHLGFMVYVPFYLHKKRSARTSHKEEAPEHVTKAIRDSNKSGGLFHSLMSLEAGLRDVAYLPRGIRCLISCRKSATG